MSFVAAIAAVLALWAGYTHTPAGSGPPPDAIVVINPDLGPHTLVVRGPRMPTWDANGLKSDGTCIDASPCAYEGYVSERIETIDPVWDELAELKQTTPDWSSGGLTVCETEPGACDGGDDR